MGRWVGHNPCSWDSDIGSVDPEDHDAGIVKVQQLMFSADDERSAGKERIAYHGSANGFLNGSVGLRPQLSPQLTLLL